MRHLTHTLKIGISGSDPGIQGRFPWRILPVPFPPRDDS